MDLNWFKFTFDTTDASEIYIFPQLANGSY